MKVKHTFRFSQIFGLSVISLFLGAFCQTVLADDKLPRYVHEQGEDAGDCTNVFRPCKTLKYALTRAGKGDPVLVGRGTYQIANADELFSLRTATHRLKASMSKMSHYTEQDKSNNLSTLIGVPANQRDNFEALGFRVIADSKTISREEQVEMSGLMQKMQAANTSRKPVDCINNTASVFPCENIHLRSQINMEDLKSNAFYASDIWGFQDLNTLREYVIVGLDTGASVVDVSNPDEPQVIGVHNGVINDWRDIKILQQWSANENRWKAYAYITTEGNMGLSILDLSGLPNNVKALPFNSDFNTAHNVFMGNVDYSFGVTQNNLSASLLIAGSNMLRGKFRLYDLNSPENPGFQSTASSANYIHDAATYVITDSRQASCPQGSSMDQCVVLADFNESTIELWDISNPLSPAHISSRSYANAEYVHSGWWSEDGLYLFVQDELDEINRDLNTSLRVFDASDLNNLTLVNVWTGSTSAIDHNGFVRGNRYYMSNYTAGLTVLDISSPDQPSLAGYFDTQPNSNFSTFAGAWGVYPFLPSGTIAVSDIQSGLFVLDDATKTSNNVRFSSSQYTGFEGDTLTIEVIRTGSTGTYSVDIEALSLTAAESDYSLQTQTLFWNDGEDGSKTFSLDINVDGDSEEMEQLALRLIRPNGSASFATPHIAFVTMTEANAPTHIKALAEEIEIPIQAQSVFIPLERKGNFANTAAVDWNLLVDGTTEASGTVDWANGDSTAKMIELENNFNDSQTIELQLNNEVNATLDSDAINISFLEETTPSNPRPSGGNAGSSGGGSVPFWLFIVILSLSLCFQSWRSQQNRGRARLI